MFDLKIEKKNHRIDYTLISRTIRIRMDAEFYNCLFILTTPEP